MLGIMFGLAMRQEISIASNLDNVKVISDLSNCLIPVYHPRHVSELEKTLSLLKIKKRKVTNNGITEQLSSPCCWNASQVPIRESRPTEGVLFLGIEDIIWTKTKDGL